MVNVGVQKNFVDTQGVSLENATDAKTYTQLSDITFDIDRTVTKHQLTNNTIDNVYSLYMNGIEGNITVTTPEWLDLVNLTTLAGGVLPSKVWKIKWIDANNETKTTSFNGELKTLKPTDSGIGWVTLFFRLEADEVVSVA